MEQSSYFANNHIKSMDGMLIKKENESSMNLLTNEKEFDIKKEDQHHIFNTTLDLSQEDIQQTLSANMPGHRNEESIVTDTMSFIENCSTNVQEDDDAFVNLDAFDMLIELPELESSRNNVIAKSSNHEHSLQITEFCPDWSFVDGGVKVLITGPWAMESSYTAYFDNISVQATVVQNGVIKLYAPKHEPGMCKVCISDGFSFSNLVDFEYRQSNYEYSHIEILYKFSLQNRLEAMGHELCSIKNEIQDKTDSTNLFEDPDFENKMIQYCSKLKRSTSLNHRQMVFSLKVNKIGGMSILHLASYFGFHNLITLLLNWTNDDRNQLFRSEINVRLQNREGNTPLMVAASNGHLTAG